MNLKSFCHFLHGESRCIDENGAGEFLPGQDTSGGIVKQGRIRKDDEIRTDDVTAFQDRLVPDPAEPSHEPDDQADHDAGGGELQRDP